MLTTAREAPRRCGGAHDGRPGQCSLPLLLRGARRFCRRGRLGLFRFLRGGCFSFRCLQREQFAMLAEDNRINLQLIAPRRGRVYDRLGTELAKTTQNFRVLLMPEQAKDLRAMLEQLAQLIPLSPHRMSASCASVRSKAFNPVLVAEGLDGTTFAKVNINAPDLPGIEPDVGELRSYPFGPWLSHVLGYVAGVTDKDIEKEPELLSLPGFRMGRSGVEKRRRRRAARQAGRGTGRGQRARPGDPRAVAARRRGRPGRRAGASTWKCSDSRKNISSGQSGSVVVMDVNRGEIISIVSAPGYDPNAFTATVTPTMWKQLNEIR